MLTMMPRIVAVTVCPDHCLHVAFDDGVEGVVSLADRLFGPMFEPLADPVFFASVDIDPHGALCWPNGADLAPDALHATLKLPA